MSFLDHIRLCNNADLAQFEPWFVGAHRAGFVHRDFAADAVADSGLFQRRDGAWHLDPRLDTPDKRTAERTSDNASVLMDMNSTFAGLL